MGERDWPEDFGHENGEYECKCYSCGELFIGHKRRPECRKCAMAAAGPEVTERYIQAQRLASHPTERNVQRIHDALAEAEERGRRERDEEVKRAREAIQHCLLGDPPGDCYAAEVASLRAKVKALEDENRALRAHAERIEGRQAGMKADELSAFSRGFQRGLEAAADEMLRRARALAEKDGTEFLVGALTAFSVAIRQIKEKP